MCARITVLGASGLIGADIAHRLARAGHEVDAVARRFDGAARAYPQRTASIADLDERALRAFLSETQPELVVNTIGVLQDGPGGTATSVHVGFARRLVAALEAMAKPPVLVHLSVPEHAGGDVTAFGATKREGEHVIRASGLHYAILRPGFVVAPAAYGGSAMVRALAAYPVGLPPADASRPFMSAASSDIARTVAWIATNPTEPLAAVWDVGHPAPTTLGDVVAAHRRWLGGPRERFRAPSFLQTVGAWLADMAGSLGWRSPLRSTAMAELRHGIEIDPSDWMVATHIEPRSLDEALAGRPATVADRWFARLYPLKALALGTLAVFWAISGIIALIAYDDARAMLARAGFGEAASHLVTRATSLLDIAIGLGIAWRRTVRPALWAGIGLSLVYMASGAILTPALWLDPVGPLVKTVPAVVLMAMCLAILDDR